MQVIITPISCWKICACKPHLAYITPSLYSSVNTNAEHTTIILNSSHLSHSVVHDHQLLSPNSLLLQSKLCHLPEQLTLFPAMWQIISLCPVGVLSYQTFHIHGNGGRAYLCQNCYNILLAVNTLHSLITKTKFTDRSDWFQNYLITILTHFPHTQWTV